MKITIHLCNFLSALNLFVYVLGLWIYDSYLLEKMSTMIFISALYIKKYQKLFHLLNLDNYVSEKQG